MKRNYHSQLSMLWHLSELVSLGQEYAQNIQIPKKITVHSMHKIEQENNLTQNYSFIRSTLNSTRLSNMYRKSYEIRYSVQVTLCGRRGRVLDYSQKNGTETFTIWLSRMSNLYFHLDVKYLKSFVC